ncbi:MAG TPA: isoprenylcysteine carboxylmethyltransferase family protein [Candidatus Paceibacterota bacterium]|nr:isoprenylcysteine carboxylmethyltransferase family protein [Candidatus Paceibacterota bacterium]
MTIYSWIIVACWAVFLAVWIIAALGAKRNLRSHRGFFIFRIVAFFVVVIALGMSRATRYISLALPVSAASAWAPVGALLCVAGIGFAVWARFYLGKNWGMPMSVKDSPELVTSGPYTYVRHPIYTGVLLAVLGSALATGWVWLVWFAASGAYFIYSATQEEKLLSKEFLDAYPAYKKRTKMLVPFIF